MQGLVSFHALDPSFVDEVVIPLWNGERVNPEPLMIRGYKLLQTYWRTAAWKQAMFDLTAPKIENNTLAPDDRKARLLNPFKKSVRQLFTPVDRTVEQLNRSLDSDLHLRGRPFFIVEKSSAGVVRLVDEYISTRDDEAIDALVREQLIRLNPALARSIRPAEGPVVRSSLAYRSELLSSLKSIHSLGRAFREALAWRGVVTDGKSAADAVRLLPWFSVAMHGRFSPFWVGENVDGLVSIALAANIEPTPVLRSPLSLFESMKPVDARPMTIGRELEGPHSTGAWVAPMDVPRLIDWLQAEGAAIIRSASEQGEGTRVRTILQKIRECTAYAAHHQLGYLEAIGVDPPHWSDPPIL